METKACCDVVDRGQVDWKPDPPQAEPNVMLAAFEEHFAALDHRLQLMNDVGWQKPEHLFINDKLVQETTVGQFLWYIFFDAIHHRGQLSRTFDPWAARFPLSTVPQATILAPSSAH